VTRLLDDPAIGTALHTDLGAASHHATHDVEAGLMRFEHRRADAGPRSTPAANFQEQHDQHGETRCCRTCGDELRVPFACKSRGFCPSCMGRRMAEGAALLVVSRVGGTDRLEVGRTDRPLGQGFAPVIEADERIARGRQN